MFKRLMVGLGIYFTIVCTCAGAAGYAVLHTEAANIPTFEEMAVAMPTEIETETPDEATVERALPVALSVEETVETEVVPVSDMAGLELLLEEVEPKYTDADIELIALVTMAEAEGESEYGKRLVIDTILNRVDSEISYMPDTVTDVIYQPNQFSSMWNGRVDRCYVSDEIVQLVKEEMEHRTNYDVLFFHANNYGAYGTPLFSEGNHYFSGI